MLSIYIGGILLLTFYLFKRLLSPLQKLPGPWYTNWTSLVIKYHEFSATRRVFVHGLHKKYGPVVRLGPGEVSFAGLEAVREIYASGGSGYDKTEFYSLFEQFGIRTMFSTLPKKDHSQRKRLLADRYAMTNVMREKPMRAIRERAQAFMDKVAATASSSVDVYVLLHCYALDCVTHFMFSPGGLKSLDSPGDFELMEELSYHQSLQKNLVQYYLPWLVPYLPLSLSPRPSPKANQYVLEMASQQKPHEYTLIEKLTQKTTPLNQLQAAAECKDHMAAGIDTTGDGLCFLMWELSQPENRQYQDRLRDELRSSAPELVEDTTSSTLSENTSADTTTLPYLEAVIKETLRCSPPIPMSLPRYVPVGGRVIEGFFIPQGTIVSCQPYTIHRLDETVFPEPDRFNPERWLDEKGVNERNRMFFAFATGGRGCTGRNLAMVEMKTLLREIYSKYRTTVAKDMSGSMEIDDQIISSRPKDQTCRLDFVAI